MNAWPVVTSIVLSVPTEINQKNAFIGTIRIVGSEKTSTNKKS